MRILWLEGVRAQRTLERGLVLFRDQQAALALLALNGMHGLLHEAEPFEARGQVVVRGGHRPAQRV